MAKNRHPFSSHLTDDEFISYHFDNGDPLLFEALLRLEARNNDFTVLNRAVRQALNILESEVHE